MPSSAVRDEAVVDTRGVNDGFLSLSPKFDCRSNH